MRYLDRDKCFKKAEINAKADRFVRYLLFFIAFLASVSILFVIAFIFIKGIKPFVSEYEIQGEKYRVNFFSFLFGNTWLTGNSGYSIGFIIINTIYIAILTMLLTAPISIFTALVIVRMTPKPLSATLNTIIEILASIPSVIYGMFGLGVVTNWAKNISDLFNYQSAGGLSTFTVVLVLTMMSVPTVTMLSSTSLKAVNPNLEKGSLALGASRSETNFKVIIPAAKSGIFSGLILGLSRALGEATAVSMVAGNRLSGPSYNIFSTTRTLTSTMLSGISEASGLNYDIRFSVGIMLIFIIIFFNLLLRLFKKRLEKRGL